MKQYMRSKVNKAIFDYNEVLLKNPSIEVISELEAYPERFAPVDLTARRLVVDLSVSDDVIPPPADPSPEVAAQRGTLFAAVNGPKPKPVKAPKPATTDVLGLVGEI